MIRHRRPQLSAADMFAQAPIARLFQGTPGNCVPASIHELQWNPNEASTLRIHTVNLLVCQKTEIATLRAARRRSGYDREYGLRPSDTLSVTPPGLIEPTRSLNHRSAGMRVRENDYKTCCFAGEYIDEGVTRWK